MSSDEDNATAAMPLFEPLPDAPAEKVPAVAIPRELVPRYVAASVDNVLQMVGTVVLVKQLPSSWILLQLPVVIAVYLGYFLLFEGLFARTPGKLLMGVIV